LLHPDGVNVGVRRAPQQQQATGRSGPLLFFTGRVKPHGASEESPKARKFQLYDRKTNDGNVPTLFESASLEKVRDIQCTP